MPQINPHIINLKESATLAINQKARKARAKGEDVYHFGFGQSPFPVHKNIQKALCDHASEKDYLPTLGLPALREKISEFYQKEFGYNLDPSCICIGPGSKELIFQALFVLEGSVIIPAPSWVSYGPQVNLRGKHITRILTKFENGYKLCPDELEKTCVSLSEPQKILIIKSPNNPTGAVYSDEEISALVDVCREQNVLVVSDEIYSLIDFSEKRKKGFMHFYPEGTLLTAGLSKSHSAGGYRLGFLASSPQLEPIIKAPVSYTHLTLPTKNEV